MKDDDHRARGGSLGELVRETADGLGQLVVQHVRLAQIELRADMRAMASRAVVMAVCAVLMIVGYALAIAGIAVLLGGHRALGVPLLGIGALHVVGPGIGILIARARLGRAPVMKATADVLAESATALLAAKGTAPADVASVASIAATPASSAIAASPTPARLENARAR